MRSVESGKGIRIDFPNHLSPYAYNVSTWDGRRWRLVHTDDDIDRIMKKVRKLVEESNEQPTKA